MGRHEREGERAIINGHHDTHVFQESLDVFIAKYVCCINCRLPEIDMAIKKDKGDSVIKGRCLACGWQGMLDNNHKLAAFIIKNPPDESGLNISVPGESGGGGKKERRRLKEQNRAAEEDDKADKEDSDDDDEDSKDKKEKKEKKDKK